MHISGSNDLELICGLGGESLFQYRITQCVLGVGEEKERRFQGIALSHHMGINSI